MLDSDCHHVNICCLQVLLISAVAPDKLPCSTKRTAASSMTLAEVLYSAPGLLELLAPGSLTVLLNTCRQVRETLQETITSIRLPSSSTDQLVNCQLLAHGHWPNLQHLSLMHLQLDTASVTELAAGDWPKLQCLNMSGSTLEAAALLPLISNNWLQMRSLDMSRCSVGSAALAVFASCNWICLQHINLADTQLDADAVAVLVKAQWPMLLRENHICAATCRSSPLTAQNAGFTA